MNFKEGDRVRIREWDDMVEEFGVNENGSIVANDGSLIIKTMKEFCGKETTVNLALTSTRRKSYYIEIDGREWLWPECALLPPMEKNQSKSTIKHQTNTGATEFLLKAVERYDIVTCKKKYINQEDPLVTVSFQLPSHDWLLVKTSYGWRLVEKLLEELRNKHIQKCPPEMEGK